ncbi:SAP domain-containing protein [Plasmodiophora brassicae]|uniref:SAP domain-containing protein n=1 Tax=Plasmodiophora brassicae TaxID=37360 RepID=A0A0G4J8Q1_PLABS|nr:hypothetical protein PBRA_009501 [Plasmodiophora brassicae]
MGDLASFFEDDCLTSSDEKQPGGDSDLNESVWHHKKLNTSNITFSTTSVDEELMAVAKEEVAAVTAKVRRAIGKEHPDLSDCVNYFLNGIINELFDALGEGVPTSETITGEEFTHFVRVLACLSVYKTTPSVFFDPDRAHLYPAAANFSQDRFRVIMSAFKTKRGCDSSTVTTWDRPFSTDILIRRTEVAFTRTSCAVAFVQPKSILSVDDDQYRLTSALSEELLGMTRVSNEKKAFGIVSTNAVSLTSGILLGVRLLGKGEGYGDVDMVLDICLDRGYLQPNLIKYLMSCGFEILGTHKRMKTFPFLFRQGASQGLIGNQLVVAEAGAKSLYVAKCKYGERALYAVAFRSGRGRVATMVTSNANFTSWVCKTQDGRKWNQSLPGSQLIQDAIDDHVIPLTDAQSGHDWHIVRTGCSKFTSTLAAAAVRAFARSLTDDDTQLLQSLGIRSADDVDESPVVEFTRDELNGKTVLELKELAASLNLTRVSSASKPTLVERIYECMSSVKLVTKLLQLWFMKPARTPAIKMGSANEVNIAMALASWMNIYGSGWSVANGEIVHRGLLQNREVPVLATSIDGAAVLEKTIDDIVVSSLVCVIEFKSATENSTEREAPRSRLQRVRDIVGDSNRRMFEFDARSPLFKATVWTAEYRGQLLHHCATTKCNSALFVNASGQTVVYAALVSFSPESLQQYQAMIARLDAGSPC